MTERSTPLTPRRISGADPGCSEWTIVLLALLPILCCGLPLIVVGVATASILTKGLIVGVAVALVGTVATLVFRRMLRSGFRRYK